MKKVQKKEEPVEQQVTIGGINQNMLSLTLRGTSTLISHKFSTRAKDKMLAKQMKTAAAAPGREAKNPDQDYADSLYVLKDGRYGFPLSAFKNAAVDAAAFLDGMKKTMMRGSFHIVDTTGDDLAVIEGVHPHKREDIVRLGGPGSPADIRYRGEFPVGWKVKLTIRYNANAISPAQIVQLFNAAGFGVGVGDWRPQKDGSHGMFEVESNGK